MKKQVLIALLLTCFAAGQPVEDELYDYKVIDVMEKRMFPYEKTFVMNDVDDLVELDMGLDDDESIEETRKDLQNRVFFYLYSRKNPFKPEQLFLDDINGLKNSNFDPMKPTKIITHGWVNSYKSPACVLVRNAYNKHGDYNIIVVDWHNISRRPYLWVTRRVNMVGEYVALMIDFLVTQGLDLSETTMVGHSLGAHVVGIGARNTRGIVNFVVGLDPALPRFRSAQAGFRIGVGDAKEVEIIHTNAGLLGMTKAIGDIDFYPNGGSKQAGCGMDIGGACSHARAYKFFAESINSILGFYGKRCRSYRDYEEDRCLSAPKYLMGGYKKSLTQTGTFFLRTSANPPYALGK